ncbi:MerR family transcriptional regulator [Chordicoccus furentiruminis]|uniref:hypothetical protein n=1 Tax=Chordicoccus furentiruminis TaxID=2709410 RepID=UPI0023A8579D|nr:hypothetical protein [Chordicoccus furentiruminis]
MKKEYTSQELRRLPGVTYDTLRTWAGRRNDDKKRKSGKRQPVLLSPLRKPGPTQCWVYGSDAVERIWWIRMLQMLGYKNEQIEEILSAPGQGPDKEIWGSLDGKINDLRWKTKHLSTAQGFAETIRSVGKLPAFPHKEGVDDIDRYLEVLPVDPKVGSSDYETGSRELLKAHGIDKDTVIAKSNTPELLDLRDRIYRSIRKLWMLHVPAGSEKTYSLVDVLYTESLEKQGADLDVFHSVGKNLVAQGGQGQTYDDKYGVGFSAYLAEAIFIYCFVRSLQTNEEEQSTDKS